VAATAAASAATSRIILLPSLPRPGSYATTSRAKSRRVSNTISRFSPPVRRSRALLLLLVIMAAGTGLRLFHLGRESLWLDEAFSVSIARTTIEHIIEETSTDFHPPLYYALLYFWVHWFGPFDATVRLLSVVFSVGTIASCWAVGRRLFDDRTALIAAALVAASRFQVEFAQEARMYALLALLSTLATYCLVRWAGLEADRPAGSSRLGWLAAYAVVTSVMTYTHVYSVFVIAAHGLTLAIDAWRRGGPGRRRLEHWTIAQLIVAAAFLPWLAIFSRQFDAVQRGFWIGQTHLSMVIAPFITYAGSVPLALVLVPCLLWGLVSAARPSTGVDGLSPRSLLLPWLLCPILLPLVASLFGSSIFLPKYTIAASIPFALLTARGLSCVRRRLWNVVIVGLLVVFSTWPQVDAGVSAALAATSAGGDLRTIAAGSTLTTYYTRQRKDGWRDVVWNLEAKAQPGDAVIFYPFFNQIPFDVYRQRHDLLELPFPRTAAQLTAPTLSATLRTLAAPHRRVWFVVLQLEDRKPLLVAELERVFTKVTRIREWHIDVYFCEGAPDAVPSPAGAHPIAPRTPQ